MSYRRIIALAAIATAAAAPGLASAEGYYHSANNNRGFTEHPDHLKSGPTREQVLRELDQAQRDGTMRVIRTNRGDRGDLPRAASVAQTQGPAATVAAPSPSKAPSSNFSERRAQDLATGG